jgi:hypothetical protein
MPLICTAVVFVALYVGDAYWFDGRHVTTVLASAKQFDATTEQQLSRLMHFKR